MYIHFIQHEIFEAPGAYLQWAKDRGHDIGFSKVYEYQPLPVSAVGIDMLIVMGGPQSPTTTIEECPHFNAKQEMDLIQKCIQDGKAVVGVCLGAQLIGQALGAGFEHSPEKEIGNFPVNLTIEGLADEKINHFGNPLVVGHWHNDMPGLTAEGKVLATSEGCPRQIIAYTNLVYGFQCHMELNSEVAALLIANETDLLGKSLQYRFVQPADDILSYNYSIMNEKLYGFLDNLVVACQPVS